MIECEDLIGIPFEYGGRDGNSLDCYGLVLEMLKRSDKIIPPDYGCPKDKKRIAAMMSITSQSWKKIDKKIGAVLLVRLPNTAHVGYMISNNKFIHTWEDSGGVTIEKVSEWENRIIGFYEYVG